MSSPVVAASPAPVQKLSYREIGVLFLPLALTSTMMSVSVPVINAGLARQAFAEQNLAAFSLAFSLSIFLESPVFALQQAIVAWYGGSGPIRAYVSFAAAVGLVMMVIEVGVAFSPLNAMLFRTMMGAPEGLVASCVEALQVSVVFPFLVATRLGYQGILVARRNSAPIAWGTLLRLSILAALVFLVCPRLPLGAPAAAMAALATAVLAETIYVAFAAMRTPERAPNPSPAQRVGRRLRGRVKFLLPLAGTMTLGTLTNPIINALISRTPSPQASLAAFGVISSLLWFLASPSLRYSSVTIALGTTPSSRRRLESFLWRFVGGVSIGVFLVTLTPLASFILEDLIGLTPELAARAHLPLVLLSLQPLLAAFIAYYQGILTRGARTGSVGVGSVSRLITVISLGTVGVVLQIRGELLGAILLGSAFAAELLALVLLRRRAEGAHGSPRRL